MDIDDETKKRPPVGTAGGRGGTIGIVSMYGMVTLNGDVVATGSSGGDVSATAGAGGFGKDKGLPGGDVAAAGSGGMGGSITIKAATTLTIVGPRRIAADAGQGGDQSGTGGKGGDSIADGGKGGDVGQAGNGGIGGTIFVSYKTLIKNPAPINATAKGGNAGNQSGTAGAGGKGKKSGGAGTVDTTSAKPGKDGTVTING
jgi:hypothetical protein